MTLSGWGRFPRINASVFYPYDESTCCGYLQEVEEYIPHGLGRSYGDSALSSDVLCSRRLNLILEFDAQSGIVSCESGVSLSELIDTFLPRGWFLKVTPGTRFVTVGGAIASDVHGKNHHKDGSFSESVISFRLMLPDGRILLCSRSQNQELFHATCGGMGLTGVILSATIRLEKVHSAYIKQTTIRAANLEEIFNLFEKHESTTYSVAWIDCLAKGDNSGRSLLMLGEHAEDERFSFSTSKKLSIPFDFPGVTLNRYTVELFNRLYYHKSKNPVTENTTSLLSFFYPLDAIGNWNRIYGSRGFIQYQLVLPRESSFEGLQKILARVSSSGMASFLAVLKLFGRENNNLLSFPLEGYTLALDMKIQPGIWELLDSLDRIVLDYNGRLYLAKDSRMKAEIFQRGYPKWEQFQQLRNKLGVSGKINSLQSKRIGL